MSSGRKGQLTGTNFEIKNIDFKLLYKINSSFFKNEHNILKQDLQNIILNKISFTNKLVYLDSIYFNIKMIRLSFKDVSISFKSKLKKTLRLICKPTVLQQEDFYISIHEKLISKFDPIAAMSF